MRKGSAVNLTALPFSILAYALVLSIQRQGLLFQYSPA